MGRAAARVFSSLLDRVESAQARIPGGSENHVSAFVNLGQGDLFSLTGIVPGRVGDADVVLNHLDVWVSCFRPLLVSAFESMNQADVHAADEAELAGF